MNIPAEPQFTIVDDWLVKRFQILRSRIAAVPVAEPETAIPAVGMLARRVLLLSQALQEAARIPVFDTGKIIRTVEQPEKSRRCMVTAWVPRPDHLSEDCIRLAVSGAQRAIDVLIASGEDPVKADQFVEYFEQELVPKLSKLAAQGKSVVPLLKAAQRRHIPFRHLPGNCVQFGLGKQSVILDRSTSDKDSARGNRIAGDKVVSAAMLRQAGLPAAVHFEVRELSGAFRAAQQLGWPVVVKPADRERGEGVTVGVTCEYELSTAYAATVKISPRVLIERQVAGVCHRVFIARGRMLYVVKRMPIGFYGDGFRSVSQIIEASVRDNSGFPNWLRSTPLPIDDDARIVLASQDITVDSIVPQGRFVALRAIESTRWGGVDEDFTATIHPDNVAIAERAGQILGLANAGVDIISTDITRPWYETGAIINEVNFAPLLGGGPISLKKIGEYLDRLLPSEVRIPIFAYMGGQAAFAAARAHQRVLLGQGLESYLTNHTETYRPDGSRYQVTEGAGLFGRTLALTMNQDVEAIIVVVQTDEWLRRGLPVDRLNAVEFVDREIVVDGTGNRSVSEHVEALHQLLRAMLKKDPASLHK